MPVPPIPDMMPETKTVGWTCAVLGSSSGPGSGPETMRVLIMAVTSVASPWIMRRCLSSCSDVRPGCSRSCLVSLLGVRARAMTL